MTTSLRDVRPEVAAEVLGAALAALGAPDAAIAAVVAIAPRLLPVLAELLERSAAAEPLPQVDQVPLLDDGGTARDSLEAAIATTSRR